MTVTPIAVTSFLAVLIAVLHWCIVIGLGLRIVLKRRPTGVSIAWLLIVVSVPFVGAALYLFVGELWLPRGRIKEYKSYIESIENQIDLVDSSWDVKGEDLSPMARKLNAQSANPFRVSAIGGNSFELIDSPGVCMRMIAKDIDQAKQSVSMLFYIWDSNGDTEIVEEALIRAAQRGVCCRVMIDGAGSAKFIKGRRIGVLRAKGIEVLPLLRVGVLRVLFARIDIRNHRKIVTIDHKVGYTGSMNMVDPHFFHVKKNVGQWVDVMARVCGPAARVLDFTVRSDWAIETKRLEKGSSSFEYEDVEPIESAGKCVLQVVPSGPDQAPQIIHDMLLTLIYNSTRRLILTTPYFIPSEAMLTGLTAAARRGVAVTLVLPEKLDSYLVRHASKSYYEDLLESGVEIFHYKGGLLHTKTVTVDDEVALIGTVNMDKRSFWINFEISLFAYEQSVVQRVRELQESYIEHASPVMLNDWQSRPLHSRIIQGVVQLFGPVL